MSDPQFQIYQGEDDQFYFRLRAANGEIILVSEGYVSESGCRNGVASVKDNAGLDAQYRKAVAADGQAYFVLVAQNGEVIGSSEMYSTEAARDNGINAVKTAAASASIESLV